MYIYTQVEEDRFVDCILWLLSLLEIFRFGNPVSILIVEALTPVIILLYKYFTREPQKRFRGRN